MRILAQVPIGSDQQLSVIQSSAVFQRVHNRPLEMGYTKNSVQWILRDVQGPGG
jgi:hypothetical protein